MSTYPILCALWIALTALSPAPVYGQFAPELIELGGRAGWQRLAVTDNLRFDEGWQGGRDLVLDDTDEMPRVADLYAPFDTVVANRTTRYSSQARGVTILADAGGHGSGAALFQSDSAVAFRPEQGALLAPSTQTGSFSISMWLRPTHIREGATLIRWRGALLNAGSPVLQELRFEVNHGSLQWTLANLIVVPDALGQRRTAGVSLAARRGIVPRRWSHHRLAFDATTGRLAYEVDGVTEAVTYLSASGTEDGSVHPILFGSDTGDGLVVGGGYEGLLDEFQILRGTRSTYDTVRYDGSPGTAYTEPILLGSSSTRLDGIEVRAVEPGQTEVRGFYRLGDVVTSRDARQALDAQWIAIPEGGRISGNERGRYLQLRFDLLADAAGEVSPRLQHVRVRVQPAAPPPVPTGVVAEPIAGGVRISWDRVLLRDVAGFRVYLGTRPRRYLGTESVISPLDAGETTSIEITGLEPDRPYVFAVESYDPYGQASDLSREVQQRAGRIP